MARIHINDQGNPGICHAKVKCPFGDMLTEHFDSKEEALLAYEKRNKDAEIPLSLSMSQIQNEIMGEVVAVGERRQKVQSVFSKLTPDSNASQRDIKRLKKFMETEDPAELIYSFALDKVPGTTIGETTASSDKEILEILPRVYGDSITSNPDVNLAFRDFAATTAVFALSKSIDNLTLSNDLGGSSLRDHQKLDSLIHKGDTSSKVIAWINARTGKREVSREKIDDYNKVLKTANAATRELDKALKDSGHNGFPNTWTAAKKQAAISSSGKPVMPRLKTISISDLADEGVRVVRTKSIAISMRRLGKYFI